MIKTVIKEMIIVLLLILAILLVLGIFLYDYIPMNKVVPKIEQYEVSNSIKQQLEEIVEESENTMTPIVYEINNSDLNIYEKTKDYQKGNVNPFADISSSNTNTVTSNGNTQTNDNTAGGSATTSDTNTNNSNTSNNSSNNGYLPQNGTK